MSPNVSSSTESRETAHQDALISLATTGPTQPAAGHHQPGLPGHDSNAEMPLIPVTSVSDHDYWLDQLRGLDPLTLPSDRPRPAAPSQRLETTGLQVQAELIAALDTLCRQEGASLQTGLCAGVALLLHRYSQQDDLAIGLSCGGQRHQELDHGITAAGRLLPIRVRFGRQPSFRQLLRQVSDTASAAKQHPQLPVDWIADDGLAAGHGERPPLHQVTLRWLDRSGTSLDGSDGLELAAPEAPQPVIEGGDLAFVLGRSGDGGVGGAITYDSGRFAADRIQRLTGHLQTLLAAAVQAPDALGAALPLLQDAERQQLQRWQQGPRLAVPDLGVHQLIERQVERSPDALALVVEDQQLTYQELNERANQLAHELIAQGVKPETVVGLCLERSVALVVALLAVLKAGGAYLPLDPGQPAERLSFMLEDSGVERILSEERFLAQLPSDCSGTTIIALDQQTAAIKQRSSQNPQLPYHGQQLAYVLYTSGSTGQPKGVLNHQAGLCNRLWWMQHDYPLSEADGVLQKTPFGFDVSIWEFFWPLMVGARLILARPYGHLEPAYLIDLIQRKQITTLHFVPSMLQIFLREPGVERCTGLRQVFCSGEALSSELARQFFNVLGHVELINLYGPTEAAIDVSQWRCQAEDHGPGVPIGRPVANTELYLLDPLLQPVPIGVPGELHIGGVQVARGYQNRPQLTDERFIHNPWGPGRLYKTGDLARYLSDGAIEFLGRRDMQIKVHGVRIEPGEIEAHLLDHPAVEQAVVIVWDRSGATPALVAYWTARRWAGGRAQASPADLRGHLRGRLPEVMVPAAFVELDELPLSSNGKLDRSALPAPCFAADPQGSQAPATERQRQLHNLWAEVLGHAAFGIDDHFFLVGGHSLAAARLVSRIEQSLGRAPSLAAVFETPTIAGQAQLIAALAAEAAPPAEIATARPLPGDWPQGCRAFAASHAQSRLWFLQQLEPRLTAYQLPGLWRLSGALDLAALEHSLGGLIERHPTLRSSFRLQGSEVVQIVHPAGSFCLRCDGVGERDPHAILEDWRREEQTLPFDLNSGLLLRARLLVVSDREHLLLINHHHIASDGWSRQVLARDLGELYNAYRAGRSPALRPLDIHYQDYALWQRQRLSGSRRQRLLDHWTLQLEGLTPLELPSDRARPLQPTQQGGSEACTIAAAEVEALRRLCQQEGATLQMGLVALVAVLLHRYSRQSDFAIAIPFWGRNHQSLEELIGFFVNLLPIRLQLDPDLSFRDVLIEVRDRSLAAYQHQELPFEQMVEALQPDRDTSRNPLVQVMVQLNEQTQELAPRLDGMGVEPLEWGADVCRLDLEFHLAVGGDGAIEGQIIYSQDLYNADRIARIASHLRHLLAAALSGPDGAAASLPMVGDRERARIESWQRGPSCDPADRLVHQAFAEQVQRSPDAVALVVADQAISYRQLEARAEQLAQELIARGVGNEALVAVCLERSAELVVALLAILKAGGAYLPLDPSWPLERRQQLLDQGGCCLLISREGLTPLAAARPPDTAIAGAPLAYVCYTSGSSGIPKGVAVEHPAILRLVDPCNGFRLGPGAVVLQLAPVAFDAATFEIWGPLLHGGTLVLAPQGQPSLRELAALLRLHRITTLWLTAGLFDAMVEDQADALAGVSQVLAGGDVLSPALVQRLLDRMPPGHMLINGYGPTEATTFTSCHRLAAGERVDPAAVPIGRPIAGTQVRIVDPAGQLCPIGVPGELQIGGVGLARGYLHDPQRSAEAFGVDPNAQDCWARFYRSGDLVAWRSDGCLSFHGRIDQQLKLRGFRIEPGEIEAHLCSHPAVAAAAVVLHQAEGRDPCLVAYWVPSPAGSSSDLAGALRDHLSARVPAPMVPSAFIPLDHLPLTANGKLDRRALPEPGFASEPSGRLAPRNGLERRLHALWSEVLGHGDFGVRDPFFELGGNSLRSAALAALLERELGVNLPLAVLFQAPTIEALAVRLEQRDLSGRQSDGSLVTLQSRGEAKPLFVIHGGEGDVFIHIELARTFAPHRPVHGLQAIGFDGSGERQKSVEEMARHYADAMLRFQPSGPYHLLAYSAGGWYAWAVAAELLRRGAEVGMVAMMDTAATADLHRRLRLHLLLDRQRQRWPERLRRLRHGQRTAIAPRLVAAWQALRFHSWTLLRSRGELAPESLDPTARPRPTQPLRGDYFVQLQTYYNPERLPLRVEVFCSRALQASQAKLWSFYARRGARLHRCLEHHDDYYNAALMPAIHDQLEALLQEYEGAGGPGR
jgi:amino acid adenylation domain-containing protein